MGGISLEIKNSNPYLARLLTYTFFKVCFAFPDHSRMSIYLWGFEKARCMALESK